MMRPLPPLSQAYNVIVQEEKQRGLSFVSHIGVNLLHSMHNHILKQGLKIPGHMSMLPW